MDPVERCHITIQYGKLANRPLSPFQISEKSQVVMHTRRFGIGWRYIVFASPHMHTGICHPIYESSIDHIEVKYKQDDIAGEYSEGCFRRPVSLEEGHRLDLLAIAFEKTLSLAIT
jgi:hypothetical protein